MKKKLFVMIIIVVMLSGLTPVQAIIPGEDAYQPGMEITSTGVLYSDIPLTRKCNFRKYISGVI